LRVAWLLGTVGLVLLLVLGFGYTRRAVGPDAALWFLAGNVVYWLVGGVLAVALRDNRAFCKYACPVSLVLRTSARPALVKLSGDAEACRSCRSQACVRACPMDVRIPDYVAAGTRLLASECIVCLHCVAVCPPNTLRPSVAFDVSREDLLRERGAAPGTEPQPERAVA
jgi:ferredoxin-type protein NapH